MAKVIEYIWKIWLRLNFLTQDTDYTNFIRVNSCISGIN
jgi:hypothetical protein